MRRVLLMMFLSVLCLSCGRGDEVQRRHEGLLYPVVRVRTDKGGGSGTVIYSEDRGEKGRFETYLLTNHHVIKSAIRIVERWDNARQGYITVEDNELVDVELFTWFGGTIVDKKTIKAAIFAHSEPDDIALLELRSNEEPYPIRIPNVATLVKPDVARIRLQVFTPIWKAGCSLSHDPIHSVGDITDLSDLIDGKTYMMGSAPIIFGDSGSGIFADIDGQFVLIGIPARVAVAGFHGAVSHMNWFIPPSRIWSFIQEQCLEFLYDGTKAPRDARLARETLAKVKEKK